MDVKDLVNALNGILNLGDSLDIAGIGISSMIDGKHTTREIIQMELGAFLLYIGDGAGSFSEGQVLLVNLILSEQYGQMTARQMKSAVAEIPEPDPENNMTFTVFDNADVAVAQQNGKTKMPQSSNAVISMYESFGQLMVMLNQNPISQMRYDRFMRGLRAKSTSENKVNPTSKATAAKKTSGGKKAKKSLIITEPTDFHDAKQYKGIHEVGEWNERVSIGGKWSVLVPQGCSYTMDPDFVADNFRKGCPLQIQATDDRNFGNVFVSRFSVLVLGFGVKVNIFSAITDLSSNEAAEAMTNEVHQTGANFTFFKRTSSLTIMTLIKTENRESYSVQFLIFTWGTQTASLGEISVSGRSRKEAKEKVDTFLNSICVEELPDGNKEYKPIVLTGHFGLTYRNKGTVMLDGIIPLPVPDGFKASTDQSEILDLRKFSIIPSDYKDFSKAMDARIGITGVAVQTTFPSYKQAICDQVISKLISEMIQKNAWDVAASATIAQKTTEGIVVYQRNMGSEPNQYIMTRIILWVNTSAYIISFIVNFDEDCADRADVLIDSEMMVLDWISRIKLPGEKQYYIPVTAEVETDTISNLVSPPTPDILHEHFDLVTSGRYTTQRNADFIGQPIRMLLEKCGMTNDKAYSMMKIKDDNYSLDAEAHRLATVFRLEKNLFDPFNDTEAFIHIGAFSHVRMLHVLRSLSWMVSRYSEQKHQKLSEITFDELQRMGQVIEKRNSLNYDGETGYTDLTGHYDWHVFYVPEQYMNSKYAKDKDLRYITGKENRGGNSISIVLPGVGGNPLTDMNRTSKLIGRNEETLESLEALRKDLADLLPVMRTIFNGFLSDRDRSQKLEGPLADALTAWCALAIAAKDPFYSEEAADTPEADAALEEPLKRPTNKIKDTPAGKTGTRTKQTTAKQPTAKPTKPKETTKKPETKPTAKPATKTKTAKPKAAEAAVIEKTSDDTPVTLNLKGRKTIGERQFEYYKEADNIIIPEGITTIGKWAFSGAKIQSIVLPKSLKKIDDYAFYDCKNLKKIDFPEGLETIGTQVFIGCDQIKDYYLPDSIKKVDEIAFTADTRGINRPTIHLSSELALYLEENRETKYGPALYCRCFEIEESFFRSLKEYAEFHEKNLEAEEEWARMDGTPLPEPEEYIIRPSDKTKIGDREFENYLKRGKLIVPEGVTEIGECAFQKAKMRAIVLPKSLRVIKAHAFNECPNLTSIEIREGLERIEFCAIGGSQGITDIFLPDSIVYVDHSAFYDNLARCSSHITVHLSEETALRLERTKDPKTDQEAFCAKQVEIGGETYPDLRTFMKEYERRQEEKKQRDQIWEQISQLEKEQEAVTGLFAGMKKKRIQRQIDELKSELRKNQ